MDSLLSQLNPAQRQAVLHPGGPMVIFAGAGSGKTRVITARIAYLISRGVEPHRILAMTFTNKAAKEMRERVAKIAGGAYWANIGTFHSSCAMWLREFAPHLGFQADFSIYDDKDSLQALKLILSNEFNIDMNETPATAYKAAINQAKVLGMLVEDARRASEEDLKFFPQLGVEVYQRYQQYLLTNNAMDFGDLLLNMVMLLQKSPPVREILNERYKHILVDEYQDTNETQMLLLSLLLGRDKNLCVVGDDDQSIYSWRGANPLNILEFTKRYPGATEFRLEQNYRCTGNIIKAASALIARNEQRADKTLWTENAAGDPIEFQLLMDGEGEALHLVDTIERERKRFAFQDIAVFYRVNAQSRPIEDALRRADIPYRIYGSLRFYDRAEIKDILAYYRLCVNPHDNISLKRIINVPPRGIGKKTIDDMEQRALKEDTSLMQCLVRIVSEGKKDRTTQKLSAFYQIYQTIKQHAEALELASLTQVVLEELQYRSYLVEKFPAEAQEKQANLHELGAAISEWSQKNPELKLAQWMQEVSLGDVTAEEEGSGISLMTLHSAKGLEFPRVYIVGVEDGLLPYRQGLFDKLELEEERRLFYVGITRAKERLSLLAASRRRVYNQWMANGLSRFLREIPEAVFLKEQKIVRSSATSSGTTLEEGAFVVHPTYGKGVVEGLESKFGVTKANVNFQDFGPRLIQVNHLRRLSRLE